MLKHIESAKEYYELIKSGEYLVDFFATWCGPCKMLTPVLEELDEKKALGNVQILKIDVDEVMELARDYQIQAVPTLLYIKDNNVVNKAMGYMNESDLLQFIKNHN